MIIGIHLIIHNIVAVSSFIVLIGLSFFIFLNNPRSNLNITFSLAMLMAAIFSLSHIIGTNIQDPYISRMIFMANISMLFIGVFNAHAVAIVTKSKRGIFSFLGLLYIVSIVASIIFIIFPDLFLLPSVPKMYFPNYYNPGLFNIVRMIILFGMAVPYMIFKLFIAYKNEANVMVKGQLKYFNAAVVIGYGIGIIPNFLVYDIKIDPLWGMAFAVFAIPIIYGVIHYELLNVKIIAKQAFIYSLFIGLVGGFMSLVSYANRIIGEDYPAFPSWILPFSISFMAVTIGVLVWRKLREGDFLKYEFITTVTHKFRTPLTSIKWATENISKLPQSDEIKTEMSYIQDASSKLVELIRVIIDVSDTETGIYEYKMKSTNISVMVNEIISIITKQLSIRQLSLSTNIADNIYVNCDQSRVRFVIQTFAENAIRYNSVTGSISIKLYREANHVIFSVHDTGIGISKDDLPLVFSKFYRGDQARSIDTEGMGIGLFTSKEIIEKHHGKVWAESQGVQQGSTFYFSLPLA